MNQTFFTGIVEGRDDPLRLGRVRVRVFGVHSESLTDVPVASLPWAIPLMPATSASMSGIGHSGTQYIEGTAVIVFFQDGESRQQPVILGSYHGVPVGKSAFGDSGTHLIEDIELAQVNPTLTSSDGVKSSVLASNDKTTLDSSGQSVPETVVSTPSTETSREALKKAIGFKESSNNYKAVNQLGYIGKYQMGAPMLTDLGYVKKGTKNSQLNDPSVWTGKGGITSKDAFLNSPSAQESAMDAELTMNESRLKQIGVIDENSTEQEKSGYLATSHLLGTGGARNMKKGITKTDANGVTGQTYYKLGYSAVAGKEPIVMPENNSADNPSREASTNPDVGKVEGGVVLGSIPTATSKIDKNIGFVDPSGQYPLYVKEQDTSRLARGQKIEHTIVAYKEETEDKGVQIAGGGTWDQSPTPYNAQYPFNQVYESESGHVLEFDDTPNNERIQLWHRTGTFTEVDRNGTRVNKIVGDAFEIWERNGFVHIKGSVNITVEGGASIKVMNDCNLDIAGDLNASVSGDANWSVGGDWNQKIGGNENHSVSGGVAIDGATVDLNSGVSTAGLLKSPTSTYVPLAQFDALSLESRGFDAVSDFETDELSPEEAVKRSKALADAGLANTNPTEHTEGDSTEVTQPNEESAPVECSAFVSGNININEYISPNFRLRDLTKGQLIPKSQQGIADVVIACNLKALATNVLEKIKQKYPDMIITAGLRPMGSNPSSQHPLGMAADIQFTTKRSSDYLGIAKDLCSFLVTDQLILEYRTDSRRAEPTTWIHVSFSRDGNRRQIFTMNNDVRVSPFGVLKEISK